MEGTRIMRNVGLIIREMRETGRNKFAVHRSDILDNMRFNAEAGRLDAIADMIIDMTPNPRPERGDDRYFAKSFGSFRSEEEYFAFWDSIDNRGLFQNGELREEQRKRLYEQANMTTPKIYIQDTTYRSRYEAERIRQLREEQFAEEIKAEEQQAELKRETEAKPRVTEDFLEWRNL